VRRLALASFALIGLLVLAAAAQAAGITEFPVNPDANPTFLTTGHDGQIWIALHGFQTLDRISPSGVDLLGVPTAGNPMDVIAGPAGAMFWTTGTGVGKREANGALTSMDEPCNGLAYAIATTAGNAYWSCLYNTMPGYEESVAYQKDDFTGVLSIPGLLAGTAIGPRGTDVTVDPKGEVWTTAYEDSAVLRMTNDGEKDLRVDLAAKSYPYRIALGPDGAMWFTEYGANQIGRIDSSGALKEFKLPRAGVGPNDITAGPDGALWFTEFNDAGDAIGRITTAGKVTEFPVPTPKSKPWGIAVGPDGLIWFTESAANKVGRLDPTKAQPVGGGAPGSGGVGRDRTAPKLQSRLKFRHGAFVFTLSEPARLTLEIDAKRTGHRVHGHCSARAHHGHRCTLWPVAGPKLKLQGLQGPNSISFSGKLGHKRLKPGLYRALLTAKDAAGNKSKVAKVGFRLAKRR
jgi:streptogramin lyase